jgi:hypothetical protein
MGASYNKSVLKSRAVRGAKAGSEAEWSLGWSSPVSRDSAAEPPAGPHSPRARSGSGAARSNAIKRSSTDAPAKTAHD